MHNKILRNFTGFLPGFLRNLLSTTFALAEKVVRQKKAPPPDGSRHGRKVFTLHSAQKPQSPRLFSGDWPPKSLFYCFNAPASIFHYTTEMVNLKFVICKTPVKFPKKTAVTGNPVTAAKGMIGEITCTSRAFPWSPLSGTERYHGKRSGRHRRRRPHSRPRRRGR